VGGWVVVERRVLLHDVTLHVNVDDYMLFR